MAASALIALSSVSPILHTKKLELSKGKGTAQGHPGSSAGQDSTRGLSERTLKHTHPPPLLITGEKPGENQSRRSAPRVGQES